MVSKRKQTYDTDLLFIGFLALFIAGVAFYLNNFNLNLDGAYPYVTYLSVLIGIAVLAKGFNVVN